MKKDTYDSFAALIFVTDTERKAPTDRCSTAFVSCRFVKPVIEEILD